MNETYALPTTTALVTLACVHFMWPCMTVYIKWHLSGFCLIMIKQKHHLPLQENNSMFLLRCIAQVNKVVRSFSSSLISCAVISKRMHFVLAFWSNPYIKKEVIHRFRMLFSHRVKCYVHVIYIFNVLEQFSCLDKLLSWHMIILNADCMCALFMTIYSITFHFECTICKHCLTFIYFTLYKCF